MRNLSENVTPESASMPAAPVNYGNTNLTASQVADVLSKLDPAQVAAFVALGQRVGWRSSEFQLTGLVILTSWLLSAVDLLPKDTATLATVVLTIVYTVARAFVKKVAVPAEQCVVTEPYSEPFPAPADAKEAELPAANDNKGGLGRGAIPVLMAALAVLVFFTGCAGWKATAQYEYELPEGGGRVSGGVILDPSFARQK